MDQKYMKLELQNREESFNKIFNKSSQIGTQISKSSEVCFKILYYITRLFY